MARLVPERFNPQRASATKGQGHACTPLAVGRRPGFLASTSALSPGCADGGKGSVALSTDNGIKLDFQEI